MKVFVIGAHGQIGQLLVQKLIDAGHQVVAGMHKESEFETLPDSSQVEPVLFDLTASPAEMKQKLQDSGADSIVFTAGAGGGPNAILVDLDGAAKSMDAARKAGINRYVMVSGAGTNTRSIWKNGLATYMISKHYADDYLRHSGLNYTILYPSALTNDKGNGKINIHPDNPYFQPTSREDVASSIVQVLDDIKTVKGEYTIIDGDDNISDVL